MPVFETPKPIVASIDIEVGTVWINASDRTDTVVDIRPRRKNNDYDVQAAEETTVELIGDRLVIKGAKSKLWSFRNRSIEVTVDLPAGSDVDAQTVGEFHCKGRLGDSRFKSGSGDIQVEEAGKLRLNTADGDISVGRTGGHTDATSANGDIRIKEVVGTAVARTANGDIVLGGVTGDARLNTASGNITVESAGDTVSAKTAYGDVKVGEVVRGVVRLDTAYGEIEVGIKQGTSAWLDVHSSSGAINYSLTPSDLPDEASEKVEVRARTHSGDITIRRA